MQNDTMASAALLHGASEERKKQIFEFLAKRNQFRSRLPVNSATEPALAIDAFASQTTRKANEVLPAQPLSTNQDDTSRQNPHIMSKDDEQIVAQKATANTLSTDIHSLPASQHVHQRHVQVSYGLVVVCANFRFLPSLADKTKEIANQLFHALTDSHFGRFSRRGSKLLINPSLIEFQDTMKELAGLCGETHEESSFFMCVASHGARVTSGVNAGSFLLFSETRLSSEDELLLTALHENDFAKMIHDIPCRNKLLVLELCQVKQAKEKPVDEAPTIVNRIHEAFSKRLFDQLVKFELEDQQKRQPTLTQAELLSTTQGLFNTVIIESCDVQKESPVRSMEDNVSNFLHRLNDAFHGAAVDIKLDSDEEPTSRGSFWAREICTYVRDAVERDAQRHNEIIKTEYKKQVRTKYELVAEFEDITHKPQLHGFDRLTDFSIGNTPAAPELAPLPPQFVSSTSSTIMLSWEGKYGGFHPTTSIEVPTILGYHIQIRGDGRACNAWRRACDFQVLSFDEGFREKKPPTSTISVNGLPCDAAFRFRIRARTAGGWGPFSDATPAFRTLSHTSAHDVFSVVASAFDKAGVEGLLKLMNDYSFNRDILRTSIEFMARAALKDHRPRFPLDQVIPVVLCVVKANDTFFEDSVLAHSLCLFIGQLAQHSDPCRKAILSIREPPVSTLLEQISNRFAVTHHNISTTALWAITKLRGISGRHRMSTEAAAKRIQGLYRTRKAKEYMRLLASAVYSQHMDPSTGRQYFYNSTTGTTSWSLPSFLGGL